MGNDIRLVKRGLFWRVQTPIGLSRQKFFRRKTAQSCIDMQDVHGITVVKNKRKEKICQ